MLAPHQAPESAGSRAVRASTGGGLQEIWGRGRGPLGVRVWERAGLGVASKGWAWKVWISHDGTNWDVGVGQTP